MEALLKALPASSGNPKHVANEFLEELLGFLGLFIVSCSHLFVLVTSPGTPNPVLAVGSHPEMCWQGQLPLTAQCGWQLFAPTLHVPIPPIHLHSIQSPTVTAKLLAPSFWVVHTGWSELAHLVFSCSYIEVKITLRLKHRPSGYLNHR